MAHERSLIIAWIIVATPACGGDVSGDNDSSGAGYPSGATNSGGNSAAGGSGAASGSGGASGTPGGFSGNDATGGAAAASSGGTSAQGGTGGDAGTGGYYPPVRCPENLKGPPLVGTRASNGRAFCIDRTEVQEDEYALFLYSNPSESPELVPSECSFKIGTSFEPRRDFEAWRGLPVRQVDWCDAWAYCAWAGKRLCGAADDSDNVWRDDAIREPTALNSEWFHACSNGGHWTYPWGNYSDPFLCHQECESYEPGGCQSLGPYVPGQLESCEGGIVGVYDLGGNVAEWTNYCEHSAATNPNQLCTVRGSNWDLPEQVTFDKLGRCDLEGWVARGSAFADVGIRCCADALN